VPSRRRGRISRFEDLKFNPPGPLVSAARSLSTGPPNRTYPSMTHGSQPISSPIATAANTVRRRSGSQLARWRRAEPSPARCQWVERARRSRRLHWSEPDATTPGPGRARTNRPVTATAPSPTYKLGMTSDRRQPRTRWWRRREPPPVPQQDEAPVARAKKAATKPALERKPK
jgi:hypothetical protein